MAQENVRLVERAIAAINARDIEDYLACCTEDVKLETPVAAVGGVYEGIDGIRRFLTDLEDGAPDLHLMPAPVHVPAYNFTPDRRIRRLGRVPIPG